MNPMSVNLPYPSLEGLSEDRKSACIIMPAYCQAKSEFTAINQYFFHYFHFDYIGYPEFAKILEEISISEMMHFEILGKMLIRLGTNPVYTATPPQMSNFYNTSYVKYSTHPQKMLMDDIEGETMAIQMYEQMLTKLDNEQVAAIIQRIIMDEKLHLKVLTELLERLNTMGFEERYNCNKK